MIADSSGVTEEAERMQDSPYPASSYVEPKTPVKGSFIVSRSFDFMSSLSCVQQEDNTAPAGANQEK